MTKKHDNKVNKKEKKLKINGDFNDVLKVAVKGNPKPKRKNSDKGKQKYYTS